MLYYSSNRYKIFCYPLLFLQSVVYETPNINRCFLIENNDTAVLKTEGVNLQVSGRPRDRELHDDSCWPAGRSTDRPDRPTDLTAHPDHSDRPDQPTDLTAHLDRLTNLTNLSNYLTDRLDQPNQPDRLTNLTNLSNYFLFDIRLHGDTQIY